VTLSGHQWWWEIRYDDTDPSRSFTTANELHVPVGRPVMISLQSTDVIHSFWVPSIAGKEDLIPGWKNSIIITAQSPGLYRGQCAEFCGLQHANMGLLVFADPPDKFDSWYAAQVAPAPSPPAAVKHGHDVFMSSGCILCHGIRGTTAGAKVGPDLTHVASRTSLAADTLDFNHGNLVAWIADPQAVKPGSNMPKVNLSDADREAVARYLENLK
jgi:cytochrome c oxidase subunit II